MIRRCVVVVLLGLVPAAVGCVPQPAKATTAPAGPWAAEMLNAVNGERAAVGLEPVSICGTLGSAAQGHSDDQASHAAMSHVGSDGSNIGDRAGRAGYLGWTMLGENVAWGFSSVDTVMAGWMRSPGHRANILNGSFTNVGFGRGLAAGGVEYWTQDFGRSGAC